MAATGRRTGGWSPVVRSCRRAEIPVVLALWRAAEVVPSVSDDASSLRRLLDTSDDALLVAEVGRPRGGHPDRGLGRLARQPVPVGGAAQLAPAWDRAAADR